MKYQTKHFVKKNSSLFRSVKSIFGDIVEHVYLAQQCVSPCTEEYSKQRLLDNNTKFPFGRDVLDWCGETLIIQFTNGRHVLFTNSEWAFMTNVNPSSIEHIES
jgi:hypothetical protein